MSATLGFLVSAIALLVGLGALLAGERRWRERIGRRTASNLLGAVLCVGGVVLLLLSIAAYRGD